MARWDEILALPVQNPPTLEFSSADLIWSKIEGWRDNIDRLALIPFARVDDFVRGESANKDCPTRFHVEARRRRPPQTSFKQKVDGILEYILYWCSFGPDDHRKGGIVRPSRTTYVPKKKNAGRPNTKRGCTCHFIVKRLIAEPSVALVIYNQDKHIDKKGLPCHGPQDKKAEGTRAMFAPYISEDLRLRVLSLLYVGVSVETIMQRHNESVERQGGPCNRDDLLTHRYVRRQERSIRRSTYELDMDEDVSISMWVESHQSHVFFYEDFSDMDPFILGIQTEWQLQQMIRFGNCGLLASDSRFGTNKLKYPVHSLVVFNSEKKAIPVAWIITPRFATADAHRWMRALYNRVRTKDPTWRLAGFIVDDPSTDILTIRDVFQCSILISFWRVRHLWHKNIVKRCSETEMQVQILRQLGEVVDDICRGQGTVDSFQVFMEDFVDASDFMDYFKAVWYPRIGNWTTAMNANPLASQETSASMELYHNQLKVRLLNEKDHSVYQRVDWLVDKLGTKVHSYFWLDEYSEKDDFSRYWKDEWDSGLTAWQKALKIPDLDVVLEGRCAKVTDQLYRDRVHVVWNPGSGFATCDCIWAEMGNLCEHIFKVTRMCRDRGNRRQSISLFQYNRALIDMLNCPPRDSLIRDHAVSLAIAVQKQLFPLVDLDSSHITEDCIGKQAAEKYEQLTFREESGDRDGESSKESHLMYEDVIMENGDGLTNDMVPENSKSPPSKDDGLMDQAQLENNTVESEEPVSMNICPSPKDLIERCTADQNNDHCDDFEPSVFIDTADAEISPDKTKTVEQQKGGAEKENHLKKSSCDIKEHADRSDGSGKVGCDFGEWNREETSCTRMDIDPSFNCIPHPPESLSVNRAGTDDVFMEHGDNSKKPASKDGLTAQVWLEHDHVEDAEPPSVKTHQLPEELMKPSTSEQDNDHKIDPEPSGITDTADADMSWDKTSSLTKAFGPQMIVVAEKEMAVSESENGSKNENHYTTTGANNNETNNHDCDHDSGIAESKGLVNHSSTLNHSDKQPPTEAADSVTEVSLGEKAAAKSESDSNAIVEIGVETRND